MQPLAIKNLILVYVTQFFRGCWLDNVQWTYNIVRIDRQCLLDIHEKNERLLKKTHINSIQWILFIEHSRTVYQNYLNK